MLKKTTKSRNCRKSKYLITHSKNPRKEFASKKTSRKYKVKINGRYKVFLFVDEIRCS
jgi:hypothetical protein